MFERNRFLKAYGYIQIYFKYKGDVMITIKYGSLDTSDACSDTETRQWSFSTRFISPLPLPNHLGSSIDCEFWIHII